MFRILTQATAALVILFWSGAGPAESKSWYQSAAEVWIQHFKPQQIDLIIKTKVMIPMRDDTRLAADVYRLPLQNGPVVLVRTPYGRGEVEQIGQVLPFLGYVFVSQDMRGQGESEGEARVYMDDGWGLDPSGMHWDGYDTVEWIAGQSWCNGQVGMMGASASGIAGYLAAGSHTPHLKCVVSLVAASDLYHDAAHTGGGFRKSLWRIG